jgi:hypothetical protein
MDNKTIIKYEIDGCRQFSIPIVKIIPDGDINIKIAFPDAKTITIDTNSTITITQEEDEPYPFSKLTANNQTLGSKMYFYNNGTIIINGKCIYEITHKIVYDG